MNKEFEKYLKKLILMDKMMFPVELIMGLSLAMGPVGIIIIITEKMYEYVMCAAFFAINILVTVPIYIFVQQKFKKMKREHSNRFEFSFPSSISYDKVISFLKKQRNLNHTKDLGDMEIIEFKDSKSKIYDDIYRFSFYKSSDFNLEKYQNIKKTSYKEFYSLFNISTFENGSRSEYWYRFDFIFVDNWNNEIEKFANKFANEEFGRIEYRMFVVIYKNKLIVRPIYGGNYYSGCAREYYKDVKSVIKIIEKSK